MPTLYVAITNHGFGHATRSAALVAELQRQCPDLSVIIATTAPRWLLESYISGHFVYHHRTFDVGVVQADSLLVDKAATIAKIGHIREHQAEIVRTEVTFLQENRVDLIFGDIPPLMAAIARAAGIPCWMAGNFGWDFIYRDWGGEFLEIADWVSNLYSMCDRLFRLPFHEPMLAFHAGSVQDVGLTGGYPRHAAELLRQQLHLSADRPTALLTFGGLSLNQIPYENLVRFPGWQFVTFDREAPGLPNLTQISDRKLRPVDLMAICDRVISKPGYSTLSEACRVGVPLVCLTREGFLEAEILIAGVRDYTHHSIVSPEEFYRGNWEFLTASLDPPRLESSLDMHGEAAIVKAAIEYFGY